MDERTAQLLTDWRSMQAMKQEKAGERWRDLNLVVSTRYGSALGARNFRRMLGTACDACGIDRYAPYELRHTAISLQIEAGHDSWEVADWAGTSERMIEGVYRHRLNRISKLGPVDLSDQPPATGSKEGSSPPSKDPDSKSSGS